MTLHYMPRSIARKKLVDEKYNPDSFRVISLDAEERRPIFNQRYIYETSHIDPPQDKLPPEHRKHSEPILPITTTVRNFRSNRPHPTTCGFLRSNVATLNEPVCIAPARSDDKSWWEYDLPSIGKIPAYTLDTTSRSDYRRKRAEVVGSRHQSNPNTDGARGIVPVTSIPARHGCPRVWKEGLSYEHIYDSRSNTNYTQRGRRQGAFVWDIVPNDEVITYIERQKTKAAANKTEVINDVPPKVTRSATVWDNFGVNKSNRVRTTRRKSAVCSSDILKQ